MAEDGERLLTLREVAEQLGMSAAQLRELARQGKLPASKDAGRWLVEAGAVDSIMPLKRVPSRPIRGRMAQATSLDDMTHRLLHRGTVVSRPAPAGTARPKGVQQKARVAQAEALEHLEERLQEPHAPERSI